MEISATNRSLYVLPMGIFLASILHCDEICWSIVLNQSGLSHGHAINIEERSLDLNEDFV
jgi:hypothetical protein